jgi:2,4-dienoyl-CoA reductase-like NADH-dependent reductase (Old Yellow Enzyme family)
MQTENSNKHLFSPLPLRGITTRNRIMVSPMCQYSSEDGLANDWHVVHLGSRAVGGAGVVITEAAAVEARGRISPQDVGIWNDEQITPLARIAEFIKAQGAVPGIQLAHAGRKASTYRPWSGSGAVPLEEGGWQVVAPSALPFSSTYPQPQALTLDDIRGIVAMFAAAAQRALTAGFDLIEVHAAHGYLIHQFLSPLSNERTDSYGGSFTNRIRFGREVVQAVRQVWPDHLPLFVRISATDWVEDGWDIEQSIAFAQHLAEDGVDLIDVSSGGTVPKAEIPVGPGYQVPFAERIRKEANVCTAAVGMITEPEQADAIVRHGQADMVALAREELRNPYWPLHAAQILGHDITWPPQYERAKPPHVASQQRR